MSIQRDLDKLLDAVELMKMLESLVNRLSSDRGEEQIKGALPWAGISLTLCQARELLEDVSCSSVVSDPVVDGGADFKERDCDLDNSESLHMLGIQEADERLLCSPSLRGRITKAPSVSGSNIRDLFSALDSEDSPDSFDGERYWEEEEFPQQTKKYSR